MKHLVGKELTKKVPFMGEEVEVRQLTINSVLKVQGMVEKAAKAKDQNKAQMDLMKSVLRLAVVGADEISDLEFDSFPITELTQLSEQILAVSGLGDGAAEVGN